MPLPTSHRSGPLEEIEFWRERSVDLSGIRQQLDDPNVTQVSGQAVLAGCLRVS